METSSQSLRFGVLINCDNWLQQWQAACLRNLAAAGAELVLAVVHDGTVDLNTGLDVPRPTTSLRRRRFFDWMRHNIWCCDAVRQVPARTLYASAEYINVTTVRTARFREILNDKDVDSIQQRQLDFLLRFGFDVLEGRVLESARYGIWSFHHGDERQYRGLPPAFWEVYEDRPVIGVVLQKLTERLDAGIILRRGLFPVDRISYRRTLNRVLTESNHWPAQICRELAVGVTESLMSDPSPTSAPVRLAPDAKTTAVLFFKQVWRRLVGGMRFIFVRPSWRIGWTSRTPAEILAKKAIGPVQWCHDISASEFVADPCAIEHDGQIVVFSEVFNYRRDLGHIECAVFRDGRFRWLGRVFADIECHASFPYIFRDRGCLFALIETHEDRCLSLYQCQTFPLVWTKVASLLDGVAVLDPVIFRSDFHWWIFACDANYGPSHQLFIWFAQSLRGPWRPHQQNPVRTDVSSVRPAGAPFEIDGVLHRPAQDCSGGYGSRLAINRIELLTPTVFRESTVAWLDPSCTKSCYTHGVHTLSMAAGVTFLDFKGYRVTPREINRAVRRIWTRCLQRK